MIEPYPCGLLAVLLLPMAIACGGAGKSDGADAAPVTGCAVLFGNPNTSTGLNSAQCRPECACAETIWVAPSYDHTFIQSLVSDWVLAEPLPELTSDPYLAPAPPDDPPDTVCAVLPGAPATPRPYQLVTCASEAQARAAGASPTHFGRCGLCSTLANLAVFIRNNDLTDRFVPAASRGWARAMRPI